METIFSFNNIELVNKEINGLDHFYLKKNDAVLVIPIYNLRVGLLKKERFLYDNYYYEFPGGRVERNENLLKAASRELKEETNLLGNNWAEVFHCKPLPNLCTETVYIFKTNIESIDNLKIEINEGILSMDFFDLHECREILQNNKILSATDALAMSLFLSSIE